MLAHAGRLQAAPDFSAARRHGSPNQRQRPVDPRRSSHALSRWAAALALALAGLGLALALGPAFVGAPARQASSARPRPLAGTSGAAALQRLRALPASAQAVISRAFGASQASFHASATALGYRLATGGLAAELTRTGVSLHTGARSGAGRGHDSSLSMRLAAVGHGTQLHPIGSSRPHAQANRVTYDYKGVQSWYASGPLGIEQGFELARRPGGRGDPSRWRSTSRASFSRG